MGESLVVGYVTFIAEKRHGVTSVFKPGGSLSRLSHAIARLGKRNFVERRLGDSSHRKAVRLTALGADHLAAVAPSHVREVRRLLVEQLTHDEFATLGSIARKLLDTVDPNRAEVLQRLISDRQDPTD